MHWLPSQLLIRTSIQVNTNNWSALIPLHSAVEKMLFGVVAKKIDLFSETIQRGDAINNKVADLIVWVIDTIRPDVGIFAGLVIEGDKVSDRAGLIYVESCQHCTWKSAGNCVAETLTSRGSVRGRVLHVPRTLLHYGVGRESVELICQQPPKA